MTPDPTATQFAGLGAGGLVTVTWFDGVRPGWYWRPCVGHDGNNGPFSTSREALLDAIRNVDVPIKRNKPE